MAKYLKITTKGELLTIDTGDKYADLEFLYSQTMSEMVQMIGINGATMWLDEEGKLRGRDVNIIATDLYEQTYGPYDLIVGDVILTGDEDEDGNLLGFSDEEIAKMADLVLA
jgi:hypothetical protein